MTKKIISHGKILGLTIVLFFSLFFLIGCEKTPKDKFKEYIVENISGSNITGKIDIFTKVSGDKCILDAQKIAIENFGILKEAFNSKKTNYVEMSVKGQFGNGNFFEHMRIDLKQISGDKVEGILINTPYRLKNYKLGDYVSMKINEIDDRNYYDLIKKEYVGDYSYHCFYGE